MAQAAAHGDRQQLPLHGVVMCCTSIPSEQRTELAAIAAQMGATNKLDLTGDVTHLIIGDINTPKYRYVAKERSDVKVLAPDWVQAVRERWMSGTDDIDLAALEHEFRIPTFWNLRICVTGFQDLASRKELEELTHANGGTYKGDLTKEITHLIAYTPTGAKYTHAKKWEIKTVSIEWFFQSLERGMLLDETLYDPTLPEHERGKGAWIKRAASTTTLGKRRRGDDSPAKAVQGRKLRRSASSRFDSQNDGMWTDIVSAGPAPINEESISKWDERRSMNQAMDAPRQPTNMMPNPFETIPQPSARPRGMLSNKTFALYGFDQKKTAILRNHLSSHDAQVFDSPVDVIDTQMLRSCLILVPHTLSLLNLPSSLKDKSGNIVTDFWLEKCLHTRQLADCRSNPMYTPFRFPISHSQNLVVSSTAFDGIDLLHVSKTVKLLGAEYDEFLTKKTSVLVCNNSSMSRDKIKHALEWRIPAVSSDWLWHSIDAGEIKDIKEYLVYPTAQQHLQLAVERPEKQEDAKESQNDNKPPATGSDNHAAQARSLQPRERNSDLETQQPFFEDDDIPALMPAADEEFVHSNDKDSQKFADSTVKGDEVPLKPLPLQERSPNSPTKPQTSLDKSPDEEDLAQRQAQDREILSDTLQALLARQKSSGTGTNLQRTSSNGSNKGMGRRDRRLFGRATSNLSSRSGTNPAPLGLQTNATRASSVDTMHTDGLGTPIDGLVPAGLLRADSKGQQAPLTTSALTSHDELLAADDEEQREATQQPQLTQVGYEDPEAGKWRARLMRKITASKEGTILTNDNDNEFDVTTAKEGPQGGLLEDEPTLGRAANGAGRRTRQRRGS